MSDINQSAVPQVQDKRQNPPGILPRNTQALVLTALALVMVVVIALSGRNAPKEKAVGPIAQVQATNPNAAQIEEYEARLKAEAQRLQVAKEQLMHTQQALGLAPGASAGTAVAPGYPAGGLRYS